MPYDPTQAGAHAVGAKHRTNCNELEARVSQAGRVRWCGVLNSIRDARVTAGIFMLFWVLTCGCKSDDGSRIGLGRLVLDFGGAPAAILADTKTTFSDRGNLAALALAGGYGLVAETFEDEERRYFDQLTIYGDSTSDSIQFLGDGGLLLVGALGLSAFGALTDRAHEFESGKVAGEALFLTGAVTLSLKQLIPDERPNGSAGDFPSGHSSMAMAMATAIDEQYGGLAGLSGYALAVGVGLQRLDSDHHDVAAVLAGWILGYVTATSVAERRRGLQAPSMAIHPMIDAEREALGIGLSWSF